MRRRKGLQNRPITREELAQADARMRSETFELRWGLSGVGTDGTVAGRYRTLGDFRKQYDIPMHLIRIVEEGTLNIVSDYSALQCGKSFSIVILEEQEPLYVKGEDECLVCGERLGTDFEAYAPACSVCDLEELCTRCTVTVKPELVRYFERPASAILWPVLSSACILCILENVPETSFPFELVSKWRLAAGPDHRLS